MKSFKEYLLESKQTYSFKIKVAGECPEDCADKIKESLAQYNCTSCSKGMVSPIQETQVDFPDHTNIGVTTFEVVTDYPATSEQIRNSVASTLNLSGSCVRVRNPLEEAEQELNHKNDEKSGDVVLTKEYEKESHQDLVGEKQKMSLLKELSKTKHSGEQYKGVNEKILAKKAPSEKSVKTEKVPASKSPLGAVSNPDPRKGK